MSRSRRNWNLEPLENRLLMSINVGEQEPNDSASKATSFAFGTDTVALLSGASTDDGDKDYFRFTAPADVTLGVAVASSTGNFASLEIEKAGDTIFETEPNNGINSGSVSLTAGTVYSIRLRSTNNDPAPYVATLTLNPTTGGGDPGNGDPGNGGNPGGGTEPATVVNELEPNNTKAQATSAELGADNAVEVRGVSQNSNDKDFFEFTPTADGTLTATVTTSNDNFASLEIEDSAGNNILETQPNNGVNTAMGQVFAGTTYSIRLRSKDSSPAAYAAQLSLAASPGTPGGGETTPPGTEPANHVVESEPNDEHAQADRFAFGSDGAVTLAGTSQNDHDKDFFRFTAPENGVLRVNVLSPGGNVAALEIEDSNSIKLFETEPHDGVNSGSFAVQAGASYLLRMRSKNDSPADYVVELKMTSAGDLTADTVVDRSDVIAAIDGFFRHESGQGADANHDGIVSLAEILRIRDLQTATATPTDVLTETEANDTQALANRFSLGDDEAIQLKGTSRSDRDSDYFRFTPTTTGILAVNVASPNGNFASLEIEDSASVDVFETEPHDDVNSGTAQVVAGVQYFIRLRSKNSTAADYEVNLAMTAGGNNPGGEPTPSEEPANLVIETEPNSEQEEADHFALGSDNLVQLQGDSRDATGDEEDFFVFTAERSGTLNVNVLSRSGPMATLEMETEGGIVVLHTEPYNDMNSASGHVQAGETYYVRLRGLTAYYGLGNSSEYSVNISLTPDAPAPVAAPAAAAVVAAKVASPASAAASSRTRDRASEAERHDAPVMTSAVRRGSSESASRSRRSGANAASVNLLAAAVDAVHRESELSIGRRRR